MELPTLNGTWLYMRERYNVTGKELNIFSSQYLWHSGKLYECCYRKNCDGQRNTRVAIAKNVTDPGCYLEMTSVTDWMLLSLLLGRKIVCKYCYRYTVTDTSRRLRDGQLNETFYCPTYFFPNLFLTFYDFLFATLLGKGPEMRHLQLL